MRPPLGCALLLFLPLATPQPVARLTSFNRSLFLDSIGPKYFRAVYYSPTPWGYDAILASQQGYYTSYWPSLFERDVRMMSLMGVNAIRIPGFFSLTSYSNDGRRHFTFLDTCFHKGIVVFLTYDLVGQGEYGVPLTTTSDQEAAALAFRNFLLRARHPSTVMVFIGDSLNRFTEGFVCNVPRDELGFPTSVPCQFGEDIDAFAAAMEQLCAEARLLGLSCTVPLANLPLPVATQVARYGPLASRPSRGVVDWIEVMAEGMPSMDVLSANLAANQSSDIGFEIELDLLASQLPMRPFIVAEYGIDAFNSTEWLEQATVEFDKAYPILAAERAQVLARGKIYKIADTGDIPSAEAGDEQASWLSVLASALEKEATTRPADCGCGRTISGGVVRSWHDEWWRSSAPPDDVWHGGKQGDCEASDTCYAMSPMCPPAKWGSASQRSPCGMPMLHSQPDGYVNEEWFGLVAYERSCQCASQPNNFSLCAPHMQVVRARPAYYALQALWKPADEVTARATFANASRGIVTTDCSDVTGRIWECKPYPIQPRLQHRPGTLQLYLDCQLFLMRGICYSPVPFGDASKGVLGSDPGYSEPWGDYFTDEWEELFWRDINLMRMLGANTIRLYTLKTSVRHVKFLDLAYANNLTVVATYEIGVAMKTPLVSLTDLAVAKHQLRLQIRSSIHKAIVMWMVGNELNGGWHFFVCDDWYARELGKPWGLERCAFGGDAPALLRAIDELCSVVTEAELLCSTALADVPLPWQAQWLPSYHPGNALGWMSIMDGSSEDLSLHHIGIWSLNLYKGRNFTESRIFETYSELGILLPVLVTEFGIDALDSNAWYHECISNPDPDAPCRTDGGFERFVDQGMQADWLVSLVEDLERHATTCEQGCLSNVASGGCVIGWADESWKGRVVDSDQLDYRAQSMACPDARSDIHSLCGYSNAGQADGFVNEEWFGLLEVYSVCPSSSVDQLRPRLAWHGLSRLWKQGGCTPQLGQPQSYSVEQYPHCGTMMTQLRRVWFEQKRQFDSTPEAQRKELGNLQWLYALSNLSRGDHGDSDCALQHLLHIFSPDICPDAPSYFLDWPDKVRNSTEAAEMLHPSVCEEEEDVMALALEVAGGGTGVLCCIVLLSCYARRLRRSTSVKALFGKFAIRSGQVTSYRRKKRFADALSRSLSFTSTSRSCSTSHSLLVQSVLENTKAQTDYVRSLCLPMTKELCLLFGFQTSQLAMNSSENPLRRFDLKVGSNEANTADHVGALLCAAMNRGPRRSLQAKLSTAIDQVHERSLSCFHRWCEQMRLPCPKLDNVGKVQQLLLYYLIWGEAANLRFMPELLCFLLYCTSNSLLLEHADHDESMNVDSPAQKFIELPRLHEIAESAMLSQGHGWGGHAAESGSRFLSSVIKPFYELLTPPRGRDKWEIKLCDRVMYDDLNEFFWARENVDWLLGGKTAQPGMAYQSLLDALKDSSRLRAAVKKTFYERPNWLSVMYSFHRVLLLNAVAVHVMAVEAFTLQSCSIQAERLVVDVALEVEREAETTRCLSDAHGPYHWRLISTVALTHAGFQLSFSLLSLWIIPHRSRSLASKLWLICSLLSPVAPIAIYMHERVATEYTSGLSERFELCSLVYCSVYLVVLVQIPVKLPGFRRALHGVAPQWKMRPHLGSLLLYYPFWLMVLGLKWAFEYQLIVKPLYLPVHALWEGDYRCWDFGHISELDCVWDRASPYALRQIRDWAIRLMLIVLRWAMPLLLIVSDTMIFYMVVLSICSVVMGYHHGLGMVRSWPHLVLGFMETQELFAEKLVAYNVGGFDRAQRKRITGLEQAYQGFAWAYEATCKEWRVFGIAWNSIVESLRARDHLSNSERDDLVFCSLNGADHTEFFGVPVYTLLPSMLSAPVFTGSRDKSFISPSYTSYSAMRPILAQMRDLLAFVLTTVGVLELCNRHVFREVITHLMHHAQQVFDGKVNDRRLLRKVVINLETFIRECSTISFGLTAREETVTESVGRVHDALDGILDQLHALLPPGRSTIRRASQYPSQASAFVELAKASGLSAKRLLLRRCSSRSSSGLADCDSAAADVTDVTELEPVLAARAGRIVSSETCNVGASSERSQPGKPEPVQSAQARRRVTTGDSRQMMADLLSILRLDRKKLTTEKARLIQETLRRADTQAVLRALLIQFETHNPGGEPKSAEAQRQLFFFCSSLHNVVLNQPPALQEMRSFSVLTPHFREDVTYSMQTLLAASDENTTLLAILQALHPHDWANLRERIKLQETLVEESDLSETNSNPARDSPSDFWSKLRLHITGQQRNERPGCTPSATQQMDTLGSGSPIFCRQSVLNASPLPIRPSSVRQGCMSAQPRQQASQYEGSSSFKGPLSAQDLFGTHRQLTFERTPNPEEKKPGDWKLLEVQAWASDRAQVLSRTVRGVMEYGEALRIQAKMEDFPADDIEEVVDSKFEYVVTSQAYQELKDSSLWLERWKAEGIDELRQRYSRNLRIAYIEKADGHFYSVLLGIDPGTGKDKILYKVRLPGDPIVGEGKPENQNHAIIFTRGEYLQTLDMNQDGYLGEALKIRNLLECFKGDIRVVGCREYIFSESGGAVAAFAAASEFAFGTILQRFMAHPLSVRLHYGHPDVWDKQWVLSNGGVSKASKMLHLSEDVFGGMNVISRGGSISYSEFLQVGKGRDVTFLATNSFDQKISGGNALQSISRDMSRFAHHADIARVLSFWCSSQGFLISTTLIISSAHVLALSLLVLAMTNLEGFFHTTGSMHDVKFYGEGKPNFGTRGGQESLNAQFLLQLGFLTLVPLIVEEWLEFGLKRAVSNFVRQQVTLRLLYTLFLERMRAFSFDRALLLGETHYIATGRSFSGMTSNFTTLFKVYAHSHLTYAAELTIVLVAYGLYSRVYTSFPSTDLGYYSIYTAPLWIFVVSCSLSPWIFNPATFSSQTLSTHFREFLHWLYLDPSVDSWQRWHDSYMATLRNFSLKDRLNVYITRVAAVRVVFILASMAALEASDAPPTTLSIQRDLLSISMGLGAITIAFVLFVVADSGSTRRLFKGAVTRYFVLSALRIGMIIFYEEMVFFFAEGLLPRTKRNIVSVLFTGGCWLTLLTGALNLINGRLDWKRSAPRRFADFVQREFDICVASVLYVCVLTISFLPFSSLHSQLIVNEAYAASLRMVQRRRRLILSVHSSGWTRAPRRLWTRLQRQSAFQSFQALLARLASPFVPEKDQQPFSKVFLPASTMPSRLHKYGPHARARQWSELDQPIDISADLEASCEEMTFTMAHARVSATTGHLSPPLGVQVPEQHSRASDRPMSRIRSPQLNAEDEGVSNSSPDLIREEISLTRASPTMLRASRASAMAEELASAADDMLIRRASLENAGRRAHRHDASMWTKKPLQLLSESPPSCSSSVPSPLSSTHSDPTPINRAVERRRTLHEIVKEVKSAHDNISRTAVTEDAAESVHPRQEHDVAVPPAPAKLCRLAVEQMKSFKPNFLRKLLRPIALNLSECFGFQTSHVEGTGATKRLVHSNMDNQIDHLAQLLKWRMDFEEVGDPQRLLESAVGELHHKMFANYKRWTEHVNLQRFVADQEGDGLEEGSVALSSFGSANPSCDSGDRGGFSSLPLSALSGDAWDFIGMWGFKSGDEERKWVCNAQLHQLMLWYLIWGEAANLRHMPELLCFLTYCASNALMLSSRSSWEVARLTEEVEDDGPYPPQDFLHSIVTPIWQFVEHEVYARREEKVCHRVMYDDINETFWSVDRVHALLPWGCAHLQGPNLMVVPGTSRKAYAHIRGLFRVASEEGARQSLRRFFHKTYYEHTGWVHIYEAFSRVVVLHAVLLHLTIVIGVDGVRWSSFCTVIITHALLKALRSAALMYALWPLKRAEQNAARASKKDLPCENERMRVFNSFLKFGVARIFLFSTIPIFFFAEGIARSRWSRGDCPSEDEWCYDHVVSGVSDDQIESCVAGDGIDYLLEYCKDCSRRSVVRSHCSSLSRFAAECVAECHVGAEQEEDVYFQIVAAVYMAIYAGAAIIFSRPGSLARFMWNPHRAGPSLFGMEAPYTATPRMLRVEIGTAIRYYAIWAIILTIKVIFGYYILVVPLMEPVKFIVEADFSCWTWTGELCALVRAARMEKLEVDMQYTFGNDRAMGALRSLVLKTIILVARLSVPLLIYFSDTCLWFTWVVGSLSSLSGWWMRTGKISSWSELIETFSESCSLFNEKLLPSDATPNPQPFELEHMKLLTTAEMEPANLPESIINISVEARSMQWQRWGRVWNEIVHSLRARDLLSDTERDELLFVALREPEHVSFFGTCEYLVFPAMMSSPVFYSRVWRLHLFLHYPNTTRTLMQMRDLFAWLFTALGLVEMSQRTSFLQAVSELSRYISRSRDNVVCLLRVREAASLLISLLLQTGESEEPPLTDATASSELQTFAEMEQAVSSLLDAIKALISGSSGNVEVTLYRPNESNQWAGTSALQAYRRFRSLVSLQPLRQQRSRIGVLRTLHSESCIQVLQVLRRAITSSHAGAEPSIPEAQRQLLFFCNSLRNSAMPRAAPMRKMRSCSLFTAHKSEEVSYSEQRLRTMGSDDVNLEHLLQALFPHSWQNLCQRVQRRGDTTDPIPIQKLIPWASDRGQMLSRTVRGVMRYAEALRIQARLEGVPEDAIEAIVMSKFEYIITCQNYQQMQMAKDYKAECLDGLLLSFAYNLRIAYIENQGEQHFSTLLAADPLSLERKVMYKVQLPGNPIVGEDEGENQNHAIIFTRGEHLQTVGIDQDNYLSEALKLRNLLECFKGNTRIVGFREHAFSQSGGAVAAFATIKDVFHISLHRIRAYPLCVRFHHGHPDVWDKQWALSNGGISKASRTLHTSQEIFAGFNCVMRGGVVGFHEFIHVGTGCDMSFDGMYVQDHKDASGSALQCTSRELFRLGKHFDLPRLLSFYFSSTGYYVSINLASYAIHCMIVGWLLIALIRCEILPQEVTRTEDGRVVFSPEWDTPGPAATWGRQLAGGGGGKVDDNFYYNAFLGFTGQLEQILAAVRESWGGEDAADSIAQLSSWQLSTFEILWVPVHLGFFFVFTYFLELWLERGILKALWINLVRLVSFSWAFFLFSSRTESYHFAGAISVGKTERVGVDHGSMIDVGSFLIMYSTYAQSHIYHAAEAIYFLVVYRLISSNDNADNWTVRLYILAMLFAPLLLHSQLLSLTAVKHSFKELNQWFGSGADADVESHHGGWARWKANQLASERTMLGTSKANQRARSRTGRIYKCIARCFPLQNLMRAVALVVMLIGIAARLEVDSESEPSHRLLVVLVSCGLFFVFQLGFYIITLPKFAIGPEFAGLSFLAIVYRALIAVGTVFALFTVQQEYLSKYIVLNGSSKGLLNTFLLFVAGTLLVAYIVKAFSLLDVDRLDTKSRCGCLKAFIKRQLSSYAHFWLFAFDFLLAYLLLLLLLFLSFLPLFYVQSQLLFNRSFADTLALKRRRANFLERILA